MTATILDGDALAASLRVQLAARVAARPGRRPGFATIRVGDDAASATYVARKHADALEIGIAARDIRLAADTAEAALIDLIAQLNADPAIDGILVQLPLPRGRDPAPVLAAIAADKDVDGLTPASLASLVAETPGFLPCTPRAVATLLAAHQVPVAGRHVVIIGRGPLVGRPLALLLSGRGPFGGATVTIAHRGTPDLAALTRQADIVVAAAGQPDLVTAAMVRPGAAVVGVGLSFVDGAVVSDIADDVAGIAGYVTPRHSSVGAMTRAMLMIQVVERWERFG